jgi:hypothetical protein
MMSATGGNQNRGDNGQLTGDFHKNKDKFARCLILKVTIDHEDLIAMGSFPQDSGEQHASKKKTRNSAAGPGCPH